MAGSDDQIGEAYVVIRATLDQLKKDLQSGEKVTKKSSTRMQRAFKKAGGAVAGVTKKVVKLAAGMAVGLVAGAAAASKAMIATLDSVDKMSSKLGVSTGFLQEAGFAASQSGIEFNTMTMAMQRFTRRAAEAAQGTGEAKDAIKELGLDLLDGAGNLRKSEDLFTDAMAALGEVENAGERLRLAFKLFDSEGAALVNVAGKFGTLAAEARAAGLVVEDHVIIQAVEASDKLDLLKKTIAANLAPTLTDLSGFLIQAAEAMAELANFAGAAWVRMKDLFDLKPTNIAQAKDRIGELNKEINSGRVEMLMYIDLFQKNGRDIKTNQSELGKLARSNAQDRKAAIAALIAQREELEALIVTQTALSDVPPPVSMDPAHIDRVKEGQKEIIDQSEKAVDSMKAEVDEMSNVWDGLGNNASTTLAQMVSDGKVSFKALGDAFVSEFTQRVLKDLVFNKLIGLAGNLLGAAFSTPATTDIGPFASGYQFEAPAFPINIGTSSSQSSSPATAMASPVNIYNNTSSAVTAQSTLDGGVEVFISQSSSRSVADGGMLAGTIEDRFGLSPTPMRG